MNRRASRPAERRPAAREGMNFWFGDWVEVCLAAPKDPCSLRQFFPSPSPNGGGNMVANALLVAVAILLGYLFWLMGELKSSGVT